MEITVYRLLVRVHGLYTGADREITICALQKDVSSPPALVTLSHDGGAVYILPPGYTVKTQNGITLVVSAEGDLCQVLAGASGEVYLLDFFGLVTPLQVKPGQEVQIGRAHV